MTKPLPVPLPMAGPEFTAKIGRALAEMLSPPEPTCYYCHHSSSEGIYVEQVTNLPAWVCPDCLTWLSPATLDAFLRFYMRRHARRTASRSATKNP